MACFQDILLSRIFRTLPAWSRVLALAPVLVIAGTYTASAQFSMEGGRSERPGGSMHREGTRDRGGMPGDGMRPGGGFGVGVGIDIGRTIIDGATVEGPRKKSVTRTEEQKKRKRAAKKGDDTPAVKPPKNRPTSRRPRPADKPPPTPTDKPPPTITTDTPPTTTDGPPPTPLPPPTTAGPPPSAPPTPTPSPTPNTTTDTTTDTRLPGTPPRRPVTSEDCPQRGLGCAALIIDFGKYLDEPTLDTVKENLELVGCEVIIVAPTFVDWPKVVKRREPQPAPGPAPVPPPGFPKNEPVGGGESQDNPPPLLLPPGEEANDDDDDPIKKKNEAEWDASYAKIETHLARVRGGVELAIEMVNGHGSGVGTCGIFGDRLGRTIERAELLGDFYEAANKHVCSWLVSDFSCFAGYTPEAIDEFNNSGKAVCLAKPTTPTFVQTMPPMRAT